MRKIGFIGGFEKTDMVIYVAKVLNLLGKKVLVIDSTIQQRARYIIPSVTPSKYYVTEYEELEIAVGFSSTQEIEGYLDNLEYDIALIDIDSFENFRGFGLEESDINFFVTAFDSYSLKKGLETIENLRGNLNVTRILFEKEKIKEDEEYLDFISRECSINWDTNIIHFPLEHGDRTAIAENQKTSEIKFRNLTEEYRIGLAEVINKILPDAKSLEIRKVLKNS